MTRIPNISTIEVNETRHYGRLDEKQLHRLIAEAVAKAAGVSLEGTAVKVARCYITREDSVGSGPQYRAECEIVVDHRPQDARRNPVSGEGA